ncbi:MAG: phosphoglucosamine mutase [Planctomycetota bacterium]
MALMVGISGVRGLVGETLTPALALEFARAYGTVLGGGRVVLGRDSRPSGEMYAAAVTAGLLSTGCEVTQLGLVMTPTVGRTIREGGYDGGMCITASHNPGQWNGLKFFDQQGAAPATASAQRIVATRNAGEFRQIKNGFNTIRTDAKAGQRHVQAVLDAVETDLKPLAGMTVVLDSVNGAGCLDSPALLEGFGCRLHQLNGTPTGEFAHPPEPVRENLTDLCEAVPKAGAAVGFAQDPDADRLAIVDETGRYIGEEYTLVLAAQAVLMNRPGPVATNLSTSRMLDDVAARYGAHVVRTPVGEAHVVQATLESGCVLGGEGNGGVIDPRICLVRDSLSGMSLVLQLLAATGKTISQLVADMPSYTSIKQKFPCPRARIATAVTAVTNAFAEYQPNTTDGVRVDLPQGWVHVRASNTEPIIRIIAEGTQPADAEKLVARVREITGL